MSLGHGKVFKSGQRADFLGRQILHFFKKVILCRVLKTQNITESRGVKYRNLTIFPEGLLIHFYRLARPQGTFIYILGGVLEDFVIFVIFATFAPPKNAPKVEHIP